MIQKCACRCGSLMLLSADFFHSFGQIPEKVYLPQIRRFRITCIGNQIAYPIMKPQQRRKNGIAFRRPRWQRKELFLHLSICNADWTPAMLTIRFYPWVYPTANQHLSDVKLAYTRYTHYQAILPDRNMVPRSFRELHFESVPRRRYIQTRIY